MAHPLQRRQHWGSSTRRARGPGMGELDGLLPTLVYPSTVEACRNLLVPIVASLNAQVATGCAPAAVAAAWQAQAAAWNTYINTPVSWWGLGSQMDQCEAWQGILAGWQEKLAASGCTPTAPQLAVPTQTNWGSILNLVALAALVGAGAYAIHQVRP